MTQETESPDTPGGLTPDEILISGPVTEVAGRIAATRAEARRRKGWIMDVYLLRTRSTDR